MEEDSNIPKLRPLTCELSNLTRADGSATLSQGDTCALISVYGPGEVRMNKEQLDKTTVEVVFKPKAGLPGCQEKGLERHIRNSCEEILIANLHPRSSINITVQELQNSGSFLATCINGVCLALLDACVSMKSMMASVSSCIDCDGNLILDPSRKVEEKCRAKFTFVFESKEKKILSVIADGKYSKEDFQRSLLTCRRASDLIFDFYKDSIKRKMSKTA